MHSLPGTGYDSTYFTWLCFFALNLFLNVIETIRLNIEFMKENTELYRVNMNLSKSILLLWKVINTFVYALIIIIILILAKYAYEFYYLAMSPPYVYPIVLYSIFVTQHEKTMLMYTKYTSSHYFHYLTCASYTSSVNCIGFPIVSCSISNTMLRQKVITILSLKMLSNFVCTQALFPHAWSYFSMIIWFLCTQI